MKSERRHELQHNELADWLFKSGEALKPHYNAILAGVVALVVALAAYSWWSHTSATQSAQAWHEFNVGLVNRNLEILTKVTQDYPRSTVAQVARVVTADFRLIQGCDQRFVSRAMAEGELDKAIKSYTMDLKSSIPSVRERANYGMARAMETKGKLDDATRYYEVVAKVPNGTYVAAAKQRLEDFKLHETKLMFGNLAKFDPTAPFSNDPSGLGTQPNIGDAVPDDSPADATKTTPETKPETKADGKEKGKK